MGNAHQKIIELLREKCDEITAIPQSSPKRFLERIYRLVDFAQKTEPLPGLIEQLFVRGAKDDHQRLFELKKDLRAVNETAVKKLLEFLPSQKDRQRIVADRFSDKNIGRSDPHGCMIEPVYGDGRCMMNNYHHTLIALIYNDLDESLREDGMRILIDVTEDLRLQFGAEKDRLARIFRQSDWGAWHRLLLVYLFVISDRDTGVQYPWKKSFPSFFEPAVSMEREWQEIRSILSDERNMLTDTFFGEMRDAVGDVARALEGGLLVGFQKHSAVPGIDQPSFSCGGYMLYWNDDHPMLEIGSVRISPDPKRSIRHWRALRVLMKEEGIVPIGKIGEEMSEEIDGYMRDGTVKNAISSWRRWGVKIKNIRGKGYQIVPVFKS